MTLRSVVFVGSLTAVAAAQQPELEVSDLLLPETPWARLEAQTIVRRGVPQWFSRGEGEQGRHLVSGEGQLLPWAIDFGSGFVFDSGERERRPALDQATLERVLARIRGTGQGAVDFTRLGDRIYVDTEFAEQVGSALAQVRRAMPPAVTVDLTLERVGDDGAATTILSGGETFRVGETRIVADVVRQEIVCDFDVEIAQASATANPIVGEIAHGASVALRARPIPLGDGVVVEAVVRTAGPADGAPVQPARWLGPFDRVASRVDEAGLTFRVARGQPATHEWTTQDGERLRLTCTARWDAAERAGGRDLTVVASPMLGTAVVGFRFTTIGEPEEFTEQVPVAALVERVAGSGSGDAMTLRADDDARCGVLVFEGERGQGLAQAVGNRIDAALRGARVTVELLDVPQGTAVTATGELPAGVRSAARFAGPVLLGLPACFGSATEQSYVADWEVEVAQSARIPDPKIRMFEAGWFVTLRALAAGAGRPARLELALDMTRLREVRTASTSISSDTIALTDASQSVMLPQEVIDIEMPVLARQQVVATVDLDDAGTAVIRRAARELLGPGRDLVIRVRVE